MQSVSHPGLAALVGALTGYAGTGMLGATILGFAASRSGSTTGGATRG